MGRAARATGVYFCSYPKIKNYCLLTMLRSAPRRAKCPASPQPYAAGPGRSVRVAGDRETSGAALQVGPVTALALPNLR